MSTSSHFFINALTYSDGSDDLTQAIYTQLLELYAFDLEIELLSEQLKNINTGTPPIPVPYPWEKPYAPRNPWESPYYYGPPFIVTCETQ